MNHLNSHIILTSHPNQHMAMGTRPIHWGAKSARERGPIIATLTQPENRNAIGTHGGSYSVYRALAASSGKLPGEFKPDLTNTSPVERIGPFPSWTDSEKIVALDPWGADVYEEFRQEIDSGIDIRPSIAVTKAHIHMPEVKEAVEEGRLKADGKIVNQKDASVTVTAVAMSSSWSKR